MRTPGSQWLWLLALTLSLAAVPAMAQTSEPAPADTTATVDLLDTLDLYTCVELEQIYYQEIPRNVYNDEPDRLYELVIYLSEKCEFGEPLGRLRILASIWDGNFEEIIYGYDVIDWLADRYDPAKLPKAGTEREAFDTFTTDFANQMLPHAPPGSLEEFFCLFYAGNTAEAWLLLQSDDLDDTWLRYYYNEEIEIISEVNIPRMVTVYWGQWQPGGDLEFVDKKQLIGASAERWWRQWFGRFVMEVRVGRAGEPYFVNSGGFVGRSDRWDAILLGVEAGGAVWRQGPHLAELFAGLGYDTVLPFQGEDLNLASYNVSLGAGYRMYLTNSQKWFLKADGRYEIIGSRNDGGTNLGGSAFSLRLGLGMALGKNMETRLKSLGH